MKKIYNTKEEKALARTKRRKAKQTSHLKERYILRIPFSDCWYWVGSTWEGGYGYVRHSIDGKIIHTSAHRYLYEQYIEKIPPHLDACHSCDNPSCVNPAHIWPGTVSENMKDAYAKGRKTQKGINNGNYKTGKHIKDLQ